MTSVLKWIPGMTPEPDMWTIYIESDRKGIRRLIRKIADEVERRGNMPTGGMASENTEIVLPDSRALQGFSFRIDEAIWRTAITEVCQSTSRAFASISGDMLILDDGQTVRLSECRVSSFEKA